MAQYLIVHEDGNELTWVTQVGAKNMKEAARQVDAVDGFTAQIYRVAGPPKTITMKVETSVAIEISP